ncbi:MAG: ABC transporter ATP-binding protein, partial [Gemmatimonadaceae bacterium]|nr:ABC transporter ATP-binding protein [Gloeobacterales cyanobacterium ES-bin-141]
MTLITTQTIVTDIRDDAIEVRGLHKSYGKTEAVAGIDLSIGRGEVFGLIGPDGAGKTTTFGILAGVLEPSSGQVEVLGLTARAARLATGYLTQRFSLYLDLSIDENLRYSAGLREVKPEDFEARRGKYLALMGLERFGERLAGQLSGGMKQKLALCCALIGQPRVLLLDEPTTGVDPVSRREFWEVLGELAAEESVTVVVATPYLDEAERCDRVALMYEGRITEVGTPAQLRESLGLARLEVRVPELAAAEALLIATSEGIVDVQTFGDRLDVLVEDVRAGEAHVRSVLNRWQEELQIEAAEPTLENVFVARLRQQGSDPRRIPFPSSRQRTTQAPGSAIEAVGLSKAFGTFQAVKDVTLQVGYGEIYGLLGANGAGKTTTIKMLCGLVPPTTGKVSLAGFSDNLRDSALRARIGYMSQKFTLYDDLTILENLQFYSGVYGIPRHRRKDKIDWVLATCGLEDQRDLLTGSLPGGWKQRVAFGASVMHEPEVLF